MSQIDDDLPVKPEGHVLLLLELAPGQRTFHDYENMHLCLTTVVEMYEKYREAQNITDGGDLKDFLKWIDSLPRLDCLQFNGEVKRYKQIPRNEFKNLFEHRDEPESQPVTNGKVVRDTRPSSLEDDNEREILVYDTDDEENWDD